MIIGYLILTVLIGAAADALNSTGGQKLGHILNPIETLLCLVGATIFHVEYNTLIAYVSVYIGLRIALFDITFNIVAQRPILSQEGDNYWDKFFSKYPPQGIIFMRTIFLALAIGLSFKFFNI